MELRHVIDNVLGYKANIGILRVLFESDMDLTGRQIALKADLNTMTCHNALMRLKDAGVLDVRQAGRASLYELKKNNPVVKELLLPLFRKESVFFRDQISPHVSRLRKSAVSIILTDAPDITSTGSARCIYIITANKGAAGIARSTAYNEVQSLYDRTGMSLDVDVLTISELRSLSTENNRSKKAIMAGTLLYGTPAERIL